VPAGGVGSGRSAADVWPGARRDAGPKKLDAVSNEHGLPAQLTKTPHPTDERTPRIATVLLRLPWHSSRARKRPPMAPRGTV
jgi:hypothetical protein